MPTPHCQVCAHPHVKAVNAALIGGEKDSVVARRWNLGPDSVRRHRVKQHFPPAVIEAAIEAKAEAVANGDDAASLVKRLRNAIVMLGQEARSRGDGRLALAAYAKGVDAVEALERIEGRLIAGGMAIGTMNIAVQQTNITLIQTAILAALADEPSARAKVLLALQGIEEAEEVPS